MKYHLEANEITEPTLEELTRVAIKMLQKETKGFYLFVEGGRIDHGHHENWARRALDETVEMHKAVQVHNINLITLPLAKQNVTGTNIIKISGRSRIILSMLVIKYLWISLQ